MQVRVYCSRYSSMISMYFTTHSGIFFQSASDDFDSLLTSGDYKRENTFYRCWACVCELGVGGGCTGSPYLPDRHKY